MQNVNKKRLRSTETKRKVAVPHSEQGKFTGK
jgi:hypothetical protein